MLSHEVTPLLTKEQAEHYGEIVQEQRADGVSEEEIAASLVDTFVPVACLAAYSCSVTVVDSIFLVSVTVPSGAVILVSVMVTVVTV